MLRYLLGTVSLLFLTAFLATSPVAAAEARALPTITVRTGEHEAFDRVVFDLPRGAQYKLARVGNSVTVTFSLAAKLAVQPIKLTRLHGFSVSAGPDGESPLAVVFDVGSAAKLHTFMSDGSAVVDITGPAWTEAAQEPKKEKPEKETPAKKVEPSPAPTVAQVQKSEPAVEDKALEPQPAPQTEPPKPDVIVSPPASQASPSQEVSSDNRSKPEVTPAPINALPPSMDANTEKMLNALAQNPQPAPVVVIDPGTAAGAAIFTRGGYVTVVFDRKIGASALRTTVVPPVKLEPLELSRNTLLRFAVPFGVEARATREGAVWSIFLTPAGNGVGVSTEFVVQPDFALGGRLLVPTANPPEAVSFTDPIIGDRLIVLPLQETEAFTAPRRLADFRVIPAAQGLVIKPLHEKVVVRAVSDGVEITAEGGLKLSPLQDSGLAKGEAGASIPRFFDLATWRGRPQDDFTETRQKLLQTIINVPDNQKVLARLDLARFYFAHAMGEEALALLETLRKKLPELEQQMDFIGLRGAARVLTDHVADGLNDLSAPALNNQPEITLWKAYGAARLRDWAAAAERFKLAEPLLKVYPEPFRSRFFVLAVESALAAGRDQDAVTWLAELEAGAHDPAVNPAILYLRGVLYSKAGQIEPAEKNWRKVAKGLDRLYKIRAEMALIDLGVATKSMTPQQAADRLEGLRFAWRGDDMEFDILRRLGGFYVDGNKFRKGFDVLAQAIRLYPDSPQTPLLRAQMIKLYKDVLLTPKGKDVSPLEALSLYMDYRYLVPPGEEGNVVRRNLAERLVAIDLLDPAANLLDEMIKNSPGAEERIKTASRLAAVKLLDHKAMAAMAVLDQTQSDAAGVSEALQKDRQLLRIRALSEMGKYDEALAALPADAGEAGKALRADIFLHAKRWVEAAAALIDLVGPAKPDTVLSDKQAQWLVSAAMALARAGDAEGLDKLGHDYGTAIGKTTKANVFTVLTHPENGAEMKDIAAAQSELSEVDAFRSFLDSYRKGEDK